MKIGVSHEGNRSSVMRIINAPALLGFARRAADQLPIFISVVHDLIGDVRDSYRPTRHQVRGPEPTWPRKNRPLLNVPTRISSIGRAIAAVALRVRHRAAAKPNR
jgi:hypothetical protein